MLSAAADQSGNGILTWEDANRDYQVNLYAAFIDPGGALASPPVIFLSAKRNTLYPWIETSESGYGLSAFPQPVTGAGIDLRLSRPALVWVSPGAALSLPVSLENQGLSPASGVEISASLPAGAVYLGDSSGLTPIVSGDPVTWNLLEGLDFLGQGNFTLELQLPDTPGILSLPLTLAVTSAETETHPADNLLEINLAVPRNLSVPQVLR